MIQFQPGQDVEVRLTRGPASIDHYGQFRYEWRKAKIDCFAGVECTAAKTPCYCVRFPNGTGGVFGTEQIRAPRTATDLKHLTEMADALTRQRTPCNTWGEE